MALEEASGKHGWRRDFTKDPLPTEVIVHAILVESYFQNLPIYHEDFIKRIKKLDEQGVDISNFSYSANYSEDLDLVIGLIDINNGLRDRSEKLLNNVGYKLSTGILMDYLEDPKTRDMTRKLLSETINKIPENPIYEFLIRRTSVGHL